MIPADVVLVLDLGTSAVRASLVDADGRITASAVRAQRGVLDGAEVVATDPAVLWRDIKACIADLPEGQRIRAMTVAAQLGVAFLDADGQPVLDPMTWGDRRGADLVPELQARLRAASGPSCGRRVSAELAPVKAAWIRQERPDLWPKVRSVVSLKDHVLQRLTSRVVTDPTHASYTLGFDVGTGRWSDELLAAVGLAADQVAPVESADTALRLHPDRAEELGLPPELPVAVGGPDGTVGALGAGAVAPDITVVTAGSTDVIVRTLDRPARDPDDVAVVNAYLLPGLWTVGGSTGATGAGIAFVARMLGWERVDEAYRALASELDGIAIGADGVTVRPAFTGERFPRWNPSATGSIEGLRLEHRPATVLRAAQEGAAFVVREGFAAIESLGFPIDTVRMVGGVARHAQSIQLRADLWQRPITTVHTQEATTLGGAILAWIAAGVMGDAREAADRLVHVGRRVEPTPGSAAAAEAAFARWQSLTGS